MQEDKLVGSVGASADGWSFSSALKINCQLVQGVTPYFTWDGSHVLPEGGAALVESNMMEGLK